MLFETKKAIRNHPIYVKEKEKLVKLMRLIKTAKVGRTDWIEAYFFSTYNRWKNREDEFYDMREDSNIYLFIEVDKHVSWADEFLEAKALDNSKDLRHLADLFGRTLLGDDHYEAKLKVLNEIAHVSPFDMCYDMKIGGFLDGEIFDDEKWIIIPIFMLDDFFDATGCVSEKEKKLKRRNLLVDDLNEMKHSVAPLEFLKKVHVKAQPKAAAPQSAKKQTTAAAPQPAPKPKVSVNQVAPKKADTPRPQPLYRAPAPEYKIIHCPYCSGLVRYPVNIHQRSYSRSLCPHCSRDIDLKHIA